MDVVGSADRDRLDFRILQDVVIIADGLAAAVLFHRGLGPVEQDVAEIDDFHLRVFHIRRDVGRVGNVAAADDCYFHLHLSLFVVDSPQDSFCALRYSRGDTPKRLVKARLKEWMDLYPSISAI